MSSTQDACRVVWRWLTRVDEDSTPTATRRAFLAGYNRISLLLLLLFGWWERDLHEAWSETIIYNEHIFKKKHYLIIMLVMFLKDILTLMRTKWAVVRKLKKVSSRQYNESFSFTGEPPSQFRYAWRRWKAAQWFQTNLNKTNFPILRNKWRE